MMFEISVLMSGASGGGAAECLTVMAVRRGEARDSAPAPPRRPPCVGHHGMSRVFIFRLARHGRRAQQRQACYICWCPSYRKATTACAPRPPRPSGGASGRTRDPRVRHDIRFPQTQGGVFGAPRPFPVQMLKMIELAKPLISGRALGQSAPIWRRSVRDLWTNCPEVNPCPEGTVYSRPGDVR